MAVEIQSPTRTQTIINYASRSSDDLSDVSIQIATGNKYQDFKGFASAGATESYLSLRSEIDDRDTYIGTNVIVSARVRTMESSVEQLQDIAAGFIQVVVQRINGATGTDVPLTSEALSNLDRIQGILNIRSNGIYLFAGTATNTAPVSNITSSNINGQGESVSSYYDASDTKPTVKASSSQNIEYGILASDEAFQELIGAIHLAISGDAADDYTILGKAMTMMNSAVDKLATVRATAITSRNAIEDETLTHRSVKLLIFENLTNIADTDIVEATTIAKELEAQITADYMIYNILIKLQLSSFIR